MAAALAPLLALTLLDFPRFPYDIDHDLSSSASLAYFVSRGVHFGTDFVQNVGPFGWAHQTAVYTGVLHVEKILLGLLTRSALVLLVLWACTRFESRWARAGWILAVLAPVPFGAPDIDFGELYQEGWAYLNVYLAGLLLLALSSGRRGVLGAVPALLLLAVLALEKHTLLVVASSIVGLAIFERLRRPEDRSAFALGLVFLGFLTLLWTSVGQPIANLPVFLLGVAKFGAGYNEAMALAGVPSQTWLGVAVVLGLTGLIGVRTLERSQSLSKSAIDALLLLTVWKHGFVRADPAHVAIFFHTSIALALLFGLAHEHPGRAPPRGTRRSVAMGAVAIGLAALCAIGIQRGFTGTSWAVERLPQLWARNLAWLRSPAQQTAELGVLLRRNEVDYDLGPIKHVIGSASIDYFGSQPGWVLLNHFDYVARPMPIAFGAANEFLRRRNEAFYRAGSSSPEYVLVQLDDTSRTLVALEDGLALGALLDNYRPATGGGAMLLLRRQPPERMLAEAKATLLDESEIELGDSLSLAAFSGRWIWLEVEVRPSLLGRARSFLLRPAPLSIEVDIEGRNAPIRRRYVASMGSSGFLASPYIESSVDLAKAYARAGAQLAPVRSVRVGCAPEDRRYFDPRVRVRILERAPPH